MVKIIQEELLSAIKTKQIDILSRNESLFDQVSHLSSISELITEHSKDKRKRVFPIPVTLNLFLRQVISADKSCRQIVTQSSLEKAAQFSFFHSSNSAGYCKARKRLPLSLISGATKRLGHWLHQHDHSPWNWLNRSVKLIDAATVTMPDTGENQRQFPQNCAQKKELGFPIARLSGITSLATGALLDAAIGDYYTSEHKLFLTLLDGLSFEDLLVGDSLYSGYFTIALLQDRGIDFLFKLNNSRSCNFKLSNTLGKWDHITAWYKPKKKPRWLNQEIYDRLPESITIRELKKGKTRYVTSLQDKARYAKSKIINLYKDRWHIELDIRSIKTIMGMDILRCKTPEMIMKEIWVHLLAYNLIRFILAQVALAIKIKPRNLSYKAAMQSVRALLSIYPYINCDTHKDRVYQHLINSLGKHRVGKRPGRVEPRRVKRRRNVKYMTKPRRLLRQELQIRSRLS